MKNRAEKMQRQLQEVFPDKKLEKDAVGSCLISDSRPKLNIDDDEETQCTYFLPDDAVDEKGHYFIVDNQAEKTINMLLIDGCLYSDSDACRCDCVVFDDKYWCFVELKLRVKTDGKNKIRKRRWETAEKQLEKTIAHFKAAFKAKEKDYLGYQKEAFIVMKKNAYPRSTPEFNTKKARFLERNKIPLISSNKKKFT